MRLVDSKPIGTRLVGFREQAFEVPNHAPPPFDIHALWRRFNGALDAAAALGIAAADVYALAVGRRVPADGWLSLLERCVELDLQGRLLPHHEIRLLDAPAVDPAAYVIEIQQIGGNCPVQGDAVVHWLDGRPSWFAYFRARGASWSVDVWELGEAPPIGLDPPDRDADLFHEEEWGEWPEAGWMEVETARELFERQLRWWASRAAPHPRVGAP